MRRGCGEALGFAFGVSFASKRDPANPRIGSVRNSVWESWAGKVMVPSWACTVILFEKLVMDVPARGAGCGGTGQMGREQLFVLHVFTLCNVYVLPPH